MSHVMFVLICCIWGTSFVLMKRALASFDNVGVGAGRVIFGALALWLIWRMQKRAWPLVKKDALPLLGISVIGYAIPFSIQPLVVGQVQQIAGHGSAFGGMMVSFVPLFTIVVSMPMLKVYPTARQLAGVVGGIFFMWLLYRDELRHGVPLSLLLIGSVTPLCYAAANTYVKRRFHHVSPLALAMAEMAVTAALLAPLSAAIEQVNVNDALPMSIVYIVILGVVCTGFAGAMFYKLIQGHGPLYAGMVAYIIPCVALLVGYLDGETLTAVQLFAMAGVFTMVALVQFNPRSRSDAEALEPETIE